MADELIKYYEGYKDRHASDNTGYCLEKVAQSDRVLLIKNYLSVLCKPGDKILDVGCGDLYFEKILPQYNWTGIDIAPDMSNHRAIKQDLMVPPYPFANSSFDAIICSEVLEHVWDLRVVHKEVMRLVKPGGHYIISTPNFDNIDYHMDHYRELLFNPRWTHHFEHIRQYNYPVHKKLLEEQGFIVKEHAGCDNMFTKFFAPARSVLLTFFETQIKKPLNPPQADMLLGQLFKEHSAGIMLVSEKPCK